jgi:Flp pilus assembly protein CpaB
MVASIALARSANAPAVESVVVASASIRPGDALGPENLTTRDLTLPGEVLATTYSNPSALEGTVARSHIEAGELLQRGSVVESTATQRAAAPSREVSLRIDSDRAVEGRMEPGDRIDVLATYGNGIDAVTLVVLTDAAVLSVSRSEGGVASARAVVLTLALDSRADTVALAHAVDNADVTVVRTTTATGDANEYDRGPYRPSAPSRDDGGGAP